MASAILPAVQPAQATIARTQPIPWHLWMLVAAVVSVTVGGQLDVSWHRSIGRDSFWTPPHMMIYACGVLAGIACITMIAAASFGRNEHLRETSVHLAGLRAPLGALVTAWGGLLMLYSAPVDNWWHNAYGLDVRVVSPPHVLLLAGTWAVAVGCLLLCAAQMNRARIAAPEKQSRSYLRLFLFVGSLAVIHLMSYSMGYTFDTRLHQGKPYLVLSTGVPFALVALSVAAGRRWTATIIAATYTGFMLTLVWGLPLIPAAPRIGPVYQQVTHMVPPKFPILLIVPAFALDLIRQRRRLLSPMPEAVLSGTAWLVALAAAEWPFASFLMSSHADNRFFATRLPDFGTDPGNPDVLRIFEAPQHGTSLLTGLLIAMLAAIVSVRLGELAGRQMRRVLR